MSYIYIRRFFSFFSFFFSLAITLNSVLIRMQESPFVTFNMKAVANRHISVTPFCHRDKTFSTVYALLVFFFVLQLKFIFIMYL